MRRLSLIVLAIASFAIQGNPLQAQQPRNILERELLGRLVFDGWKEVVAYHQQEERKTGFILKYWVYIDGRIIRRLPLGGSEELSDSLWLPPGTYKLEVLGLSANVLSFFLCSRDISVKAGSTLRDSMFLNPKSNKIYGRPFLKDLLQGNTREVRGEKVEVRKIDDDELICEGIRPFRSVRFFFMGPTTRTLFFEPRPNEDLRDALERYKNRIEKDIRTLKDNPVVTALLNTAAELDHRPPSSRRHWVNFPLDEGGPREADADLVRILAKRIGEMYPVSDDITPRISGPEEFRQPMRDYYGWYKQQVEFILGSIDRIADKLDKVPQ